MASSDILESVPPAKPVKITNALPLDSAEPLPFSSEVKAGELENGLRWYVKKNPEPQKRAELRLCVNVGSISEQEHERGIAHIVEHLAFRSTEKYPEKQDVVNYLEAIGAQFGPCQNAYTSFEETVYELHIPVDDTETLRTSLGVLAQWCSKIRISDEDVDEERTIVLEEWRQQQSASMRATVAYTQGLVGDDSVYANRFPIGLPEVIKTVKGQVLRDFYKRFYVPANMAVVCVGDFPVPEEDVIGMITEIFGGMPAAAPETPPPLHMQPWRALGEQAAPTVLILPDDETTSSSITVDCQQERYIVRTEDDYRISIVRDLMHRSVNNRLFKISLGSTEKWMRSVMGVGALGDEDDEEGDDWSDDGGDHAKQGDAGEPAGIGAQAGGAAEAEASDGDSLPSLEIVGSKMTLHPAADGAAQQGGEQEGDEDGGEEGEWSDDGGDGGGGVEAPILSGSSYYSNPVPPLETMMLYASAQQGRVVPALRCMLIEIERVKKHGISEDEIERVKADILSDLETAYRERNQIPSVAYAEECCEHFLREEPVMELEAELAMCKRVLGTISASEASECAKLHDWSKNCLVKVQLPSEGVNAEGAAAAATGDTSAEAAAAGTADAADPPAGKYPAGWLCAYQKLDLPSIKALAEGGSKGRGGLCEADIQAVFSDVAALSAADGIAPWPENSGEWDLKPEALPPPATVVSRRVWTQDADGCDLTEVVLDSGIRIVLKATDFLDDDLSFSAFAWQGLSQLPPDRLMGGRLSMTVAEELGWAGIPRTELLDLLAGLKLSANPSVGAYSRSVTGDCSPSDLEPLLQLVHRLFTQHVTIDDDAMDRLATLRAILRESITNRDQDPDGVFGRKVSEVNTSSHPCYRPLEIADVDALGDISVAQKSGQVFDAAFNADGGGWTLVMVGNLVEEDVLPLLLQYFGTMAAAAGGAKATTTTTTTTTTETTAVGTRTTTVTETTTTPASAQSAVASGSAMFVPERDGIKTLDVKFPEGSTDVKVERKMLGEPRSRACITFKAAPIERTAGKLDSLRLLTEIDLAVGILEKCLRDILRFDKNGVYDVSAGTTYGTSPPLLNEPLNGLLQIDFDCAPERQPELIKAMFDEFEKRVRNERDEAHIHPPTASHELFHRLTGACGCAQLTAC